MEECFKLHLFDSCLHPFILVLTLFPLRYLGPLYHFGGWGGGGGVILQPPPPQFSRKELVQFTLNLISILPTTSTSKINQNGTLDHVSFLMTSSYFLRFSKILMNFQFELTFDVKNYFLLLLRFLKENLLEISNK